MRLKQIKLAGFKSFVDPTTVPYPENLSAIVGPNGCGKSNIIDAVRWVMGESSAKNLRGDAMTDVIFNGSSARKPVGQASVELVFDNTEGKLLGEYASYNELSIRRIVTRDSQSTYYLNGTRCRRKDITDIFLGTGLGPRSYAIIEQGMISRLIESKPHELRVFIEEAAGISKYKERRRETENRIRHTRENLERLSDLREELGKQLSHLQRQAQAAEKYKQYKADERTLKAQLAAIRWQQLNHSVEALEAHIRDLTVELEAKASEQQGTDTAIEKQRELQIEMNDKFNEVQGRYYGVGASISRLEQDLKYRADRKIELSQDLEHSKISLKNVEEHQLIDAEKVHQLQKELHELEPEVNQIKETAEQSSVKLGEADGLMNQWQQEWDTFNQLASSNSQQSEILKTRMQHFDSSLQRQQQKRETLIIEKNKLMETREDDDTVQLLESLELAKERIEETAETVESKQNELTEQRDERNQIQSQLDEQSKALQQLEGRKVSLEALQQAALGKSSEHVSSWLEHNGLSHAKRLAEKIQVESGWEKAVETVLGDYLQAVIVDDLSDPGRILSDFNSGSITLIDSTIEVLNQSLSNNFTALLSKVDAKPAYKFALENVFIAETLEEALSIRVQLKDFQSVVTPDGIWMGPNWLRISKDEDTNSGIIAREKELEQVTENIEQQRERVDELQHRLQTVRENLITIEQQWQTAQSQLLQLNQQHAQLDNKLQSQRSNTLHMQQRIERLEIEINDLALQKQQDEERLSETRIALEAAVELMAKDELTRKELLQIREERRENLIHVRDKAREDKDLVHKLALRTESIRTELNSTQNSQGRASEQVKELTERLTHLIEQMEENEAPIEEKKLALEEALEKHLLVEDELKTAREKLDQSEQQLRELEKQRLNYEQSYDAIRRKLETEKLNCQAQTIQRENQQNVLSELNQNLKEVIASLPEGATEESWGEQIAKVAVRIERLGAINLAAIEEFDSQSERKVYLDAQHEDLVEALDTLESAIRKIDRETRTKFKETFDKINKGLQELFPKVFGGGHAYLELTGEDLLDTGVTIMARPPGKRNSTIHLLSGGEKAMTAIALVFAIFHLNPAPFCMLDEVDAPLDDANVGRYCRLVEEMSKKIQFIYISHNKQAMEMAHSLVGVTMQEPGVSRMVSVDIEEAAALAGQ